MTRGNRFHQHPEAEFTLGAQDVEGPVEEEWKFPDPLPSPLPMNMAVDIIAAEFLSIQDDLEYAAGSIGCRLQRIEKTLRDTMGGRAAG